MFMAIPFIKVVTVTLELVHHTLCYNSNGGAVPQSLVTGGCFLLFFIKHSTVNHLRC